MSTLNELINKFCPHGVKYVRLGDVCLLNRYKQLSAEELKSLKTNNGDIHLLPSSRNFDWITTKQLAGNLVCHGEIFTIGKACYANPKYVNGYFISSNNIIVESKNRGKISTKYLYYFVISNEKRIYVETPMYPKFDKPSFNMLKIPLPPLRVQEEIVKILDKFTDLENELENELRMRKMQFNAYRDKLLTFDNGVRFEKMYKLTAWNKKFNGVEKIKQKKIVPYKYILASEFEKIKQNSGNVKYIATGISGKDQYTTEELAGNYLSEGEVVCIPGGGTPNVKYHNGKFITSGNCVATSLDKSILSNKFLYYYLDSKIKSIAKFYRGSGIKHPDMLKVLELTIPVPPLEKQKEIVEKLDKFNDMCNEISDGLPLEIELRKKQYEFYRDKLLSFDKKAS